MPSPVTIFSSTPSPSATGLGNQGHVGYAPNQGAWWCVSLTGTSQLQARYSTDFVTWTTPTSGSPFTLANPHSATGTNFGFAFAGIGSADVMHMTSNDLTGSSVLIADPYHARFALSAANFNNTNAEALVNSATGSIHSQIQSGAVTILDSTGTPADLSSYLNPALSAVVARGSHADSGSSWTAGFGANSTLFTVSGNWVTSFGLADLGSGNLLAVGDNANPTGQFTNLKFSVWNGTSWGAAANVFGTAVTAADTAAWCLRGLSTSDVHLVALSNASNAYEHVRFNGSSWSAGDSIPTLSYGTHGGLSLSQDGTSVYLYAIDSAGGKGAVQRTTWTSGSGWSSWTAIAAVGTNARTYVSAVPAAQSGNVGVTWTEVNGSNYDVKGLLDGPGAVTTTLYGADPSSSGEFALGIPGDFDPWSSADAAWWSSDLYLADASGAAESWSGIGYGGEYATSSEAPLVTVTGTTTVTMTDTASGDDVALVTVLDVDPGLSSDLSWTQSTLTASDQGFLDSWTAKDLSLVSWLDGDGASAPDPASLVFFILYGSDVWSWGEFSETSGTVFGGDVGATDLATASDRNLLVLISQDLAAASEPYLIGTSVVIVGTGYHVYGNDAHGGPIDYSTPIADVTPLSASYWISSVLAAPGDYRFGIRAYNGNGEEQNLDASVEIVLDQYGNDITFRPLPPFGLRAFPF